MQPCRSLFLKLTVLVLIPGIALALGSRPKPMDEEATNLRIQPVAKVKLAPLTAAGSAKGSRSGEELYKAVCSACHGTGVAGAPKLGDKAAWAPRIATGLDALQVNAIKGLNAMPPRGGSDASDEEIRRAVIFMTNQSGANFKE